MAQPAPWRARFSGTDANRHERCLALRPDPIVVTSPVISRRHAIKLALSVPLAPILSGCRANLPPVAGEARDPEALALLKDSAAAHGLGAYESLTDVNVSYTGHWRHLVRVLQPALVDAGFRGSSEERLLVHGGVSAQAYTGPQGRKQVLRTYSVSDENHVQVWFNGEMAADRDQLDAAALVADAYWLFLLGPLLLVSNRCPRRDIAASLASPTELTLGGRKHLCDVLNLTLRPGFGHSPSDRAALYIDRDTRLMQRVRMTLNGLQSTQGALVDIDVSDHQNLAGVQCPTAFHERLLRPGPLDVHHWQLNGFDVNRGEAAAELSGNRLSGKAALAARSWRS